MSQEERIKYLESELFKMKYELNVLKSILSMNEVPDWAVTAMKEVQSLGVKESPYGNSLDYFIIIELLSRRGVL